MIVLGIESSCDDSAAAVLRDGRLRARRSSSSQDAVHGPYGGVVPELASRQHVRTMLAGRRRGARARAGSASTTSTASPSRAARAVGSLLVGLSVAKGIALRRGLPLVGVNHLEGHLLAANLDRPADEPVPFPFLGLLVSGGHTGLYLARAPGDYALLGKTRDDAVGEAFDKVAKLLGLGYPGGPAIDRLARDGDPTRHPLPARAPEARPLRLQLQRLQDRGLAVRARRSAARPSALPDIAASVQEALVDMLVDATAEALDATGVERLVVSGGVVGQPPPARAHGRAAARARRRGRRAAAGALHRQRGDDRARRLAAPRCGRERRARRRRRRDAAVRRRVAGEGRR